MKNLIHAELLKLRTTRMIYGLALSVLASVLPGVISTITMAGKSGGAPALSTSEGIRNVMSASSSGYTVVLVIGILIMAGEFRHNTATSTFLISPTRGRVVGAKLAASALVGAALAVIASALTLAVAVPWLATKHIHVEFFSHNVGLVLLGGIAATTIYATVGVGVGSLIRNQTAAVVIALAWVLVVDTLLVSFAHEIGKWTPDGASTALANRAASAGLLPMWGGALLLVAYAVAFATTGARLTIRRDVS
jgi:ABC-type transport system involved in multi-copper enzyme maturation permease subunit